MLEPFVSLLCDLGATISVCNLGATSLSYRKNVDIVLPEIIGVRTTHLLNWNLVMFCSGAFFLHGTVIPLYFSQAKWTTATNEM